MDDEIRHPLAHARNERGWPQEELARRIRQAAKRRGLRSGTRGSRVSKWETGRATPDEDESQPLIAEVLGIDYAAGAHLGWPHWLPGQDRPLPLGPHNAVPSLREALMSSLDRRSFIAYTSGSLAVLAYQWAATEPGRFARFAAPGEADAEMLDWLEATGTQLIRLATERRHRTRHLLGAHLTTVTEFISESRYTPAAGQRLHTLAASLSQAIAWQHFDERRHASAGRFWHAALHNAHTAHQRDLGAGVLSDLAYQLLWLGDARAAADILEHAIPRTQHPTARSLLHLRQARALAALNEGGLCRRALTAAEKALDTPSYDPAPAWCSWKKALRVPIPADRGPGRPWRPGTPPPVPIDPDLPSADIRIGCARCSTLGQELDSQLDALSKHGIPRDKIFSEKISTRVRVRPRFEEALRTAREVKAHAPHCRVIFTVYEMKRLGRDAAELTALADHLTAHGLVLEMLAGPLPGIYDPTGPGKLLFAFFAAMAETERENISKSTLEGLDTAARKGKHGGRPPVITDDMLHTVLRRRALGESVEQIQPDLIIPTGKRKGQSPSVASIYTGRSPNTPSARHTPKPSSRPTPTSPPSRPAKSPGPASLSLTERHSDYRELLVASP